MYFPILRFDHPLQLPTKERLSGQSLFLLVSSLKCSSRQLYLLSVVCSGEPNFDLAKRKLKLIWEIPLHKVTIENCDCKLEWFIQLM